MLCSTLMEAMWRSAEATISNNYPSQRIAWHAWHDSLGIPNDPRQRLVIDGRTLTDQRGRVMNWSDGGPGTGEERLSKVAEFLSYYISLETIHGKLRSEADVGKVSCHPSGSGPYMY